MSLLCRLKNLVHKGVLKKEDLDRIVIIPKEQEPCEDMVSRKEVLKQLKSCLTGGETEYNYVKIHIDSIPPVKPKLQMVQNPCVECGYNYCTNDNCKNRYIVDIAESEG